MIASKVNDAEKLKLIDRFNLIYSRLNKNLSNKLDEKELFAMYCQFVKENSNLQSSYILNIEGFTFQNEDDMKIDEQALNYLQSEIMKKEK